jgi:hypothetical protein
MRTIRFCFGIVRYAKLNRRVVISIQRTFNHFPNTNVFDWFNPRGILILLGSFKFNVILVIFLASSRKYAKGCACPSITPLTSSVHQFRCIHPCARVKLCSRKRSLGHIGCFRFSLKPLISDNLSRKIVFLRHNLQESKAVWSPPSQIGFFLLWLQNK